MVSRGLGGHNGRIAVRRGHRGGSVRALATPGLEGETQCVD